MAIIAKPNFSLAYSKANEMLAISNVITGFPFCTKDLVKEQSGIRFCTYKKALDKFNLDVTAFGSESAIIMEYGIKTIVFYDDSKPQPHVDFSILHEWGHHVNGHNLGVDDPEVYQRYEIETNYFAAQLLMPEQLLRELQKRSIRVTVPFLQQHFGVSKQAAEKRIETLAKTSADWRSRCEQEYDDILLYKYASFLDRICPMRPKHDLQYEFDLQEERYSWY